MLPSFKVGPVSRAALELSWLTMEPIADSMLPVMQQQTGEMLVGDTEKSMLPPIQ